MYGTTQERVKRAAESFVSPLQIRTLAVTARKAYGIQYKLGLTDDDFDTWRRGVIWDACSKKSFKLLGQTDYELALNAFNCYINGNRRVDSETLRLDGEKKRARYVLDCSLRKFDDERVFGPNKGNAFAYAETIARMQYRHTLNECEAKELYQILFTVKARAKVKK